MTEFEFGVGMDPIHPPQEVIAYAQMAEAFHFKSYWIADSQLLMREAHVLLAACAVNTRTLLLGTGVTNPLTRHLSVIASAFATLDELAPGRLILGIAPGDSAVRTIGMRPASLSALEQAILAIRDLLAGKEVEFNGYQTRLNAPRPVPIYLAATGPKMLRMAGRIADGVLLGFLADADQIQAGMEEVWRGAKEAGRAMDGFRAIGWMPCSISSDREKARQQVKVHVARHVLHKFPADLGVEEEVVSKIRAGYDYAEHMIPGARHADLVPEQLVDRFALAGTPSEVLRQTRAVLDAGLNHLVIVPRGDKRLIVELFARDVMSKL